MQLRQRLYNGVEIGPKHPMIVVHIQILLNVVTQSQRLLGIRHLIRKALQEVKDNMNKTFRHQHNPISKAKVRLPCRHANRKPRRHQKDIPSSTYRRTFLSSRKQTEHGIANSVVMSILPIAILMRSGRVAVEFLLQEALLNRI